MSKSSHHPIRRGRYTAPSPRRLSLVPSSVRLPKVRTQAPALHDCPACAAEREGRDVDAFFAETQAERNRRVDAGEMMITYVDDDVPWAYTIGRILDGSPELLVLGVDPSSAAGVLNRLHGEWPRVEEWMDGQPEDDPFYASLRLIPIPDRLWDTTDYLLLAADNARRCGLSDEREALQVVWADPAGVFPWEPGFSRRLAALQPILGLQPF